MLTIDTAKINAIAQRHNPAAWQGLAAEATALVSAASRMTIPIEDHHLIDWKRGRGMQSSAEMANDRRRNTWLKFAREIIQSLPHTL